jgi:hypothetical protein
MIAKMAKLTMEGEGGGDNNNMHENITKKGETPEGGFYEGERRNQMYATGYCTTITTQLL